MNLPYRSSARFVVVTTVALVALENDEIGLTETPNQAAIRKVEGAIRDSGHDIKIDALESWARYVYHSGERGDIFREEVNRLMECT